MNTPRRKRQIHFDVGFPRDGTWDVPLSHCPGTKKFSCPGVPLSRDKGRSKCPGTSPSLKKTKNSKKDVLKQEKDVLKQEKDVLKQEMKF